MTCGECSERPARLKDSLTEPVKTASAEACTALPSVLAGVRRAAERFLRLSCFQVSAVRELQGSAPR